MPASEYPNWRPDARKEWFYLSILSDEQDERLWRVPRISLLIIEEEGACRFEGRQAPFSTGEIEENRKMASCPVLSANEQRRKV